MLEAMAPLILAIVMGCASVSAHADVVHKWVDSDGITHYSDEAPASSAIPVSMIEMGAADREKADVEADYYSIANQWQRLREERIEREKLKLELARIKSVQQPASPQVVYINGRRGNRYAVPYSGPVYPKYGRKGHSRKLKPQPRHIGTPRQGLRAIPPARVRGGQLTLGSNR